MYSLFFTFLLLFQTNNLIQVKVNDEPFDSSKKYGLSDNFKIDFNTNRIEYTKVDFTVAGSGEPDIIRGHTYTEPGVLALADLRFFAKPGNKVSMKFSTKTKNGQERVEYYNFTFK